MKIFSYIVIAILSLENIIMFFYYKNIIKQHEKLVGLPVDSSRFVVLNPQKAITGLTVSHTVYNYCAILLNLVLPINIWINIIILFIDFFFIFFCIVAREKIMIVVNTIIYTPAFGKNRVYKITDIKSVKKLNSKLGFIRYVFYTDKKIFAVEDVLVNYDLMVLKIGEWKLTVANDK